MAGHREWFGVEPPDDTPTPDAGMFSRGVQRTLRQYAEAAGREAWEQATRDGDPVAGAGTDDLVALGMRSLAGGSSPAADPPPSAAGEEDLAEPMRPADPDGPLVRPPDVRFTTARRGDSISRLVGSSDPEAQ